MEEVYGYTESQWTPPSGNCLHRIAPEAAMVINFGSKTYLWQCEIAIPKLVFKRHKTAPLVSSSKQQAV